MARDMKELVEEWENGSYDMTNEQVLTWAEQAAASMRAATAEGNAKLDPKPWEFGSLRMATRTPGFEWQWKPRPQYEQSASIYPREYFN